MKMWKFRHFRKTHIFSESNQSARMLSMTACIRDDEKTRLCSWRMSTSRAPINFCLSIKIRPYDAIFSISFFVMRQIKQNMRVVAQTSKSKTFNSTKKTPMKKTTGARLTSKPCLSDGENYFPKSAQEIAEHSGRLNEFRKIPSYCLEFRGVMLFHV